MPRHSSPKSRDYLDKPKTFRVPLMESWIQIQTELKDKHLNNEALVILEKIQDKSTTYFEIEEMMKRLEFITPTMLSGKSNFSILISFRLLEMNADYLTFIQRCNYYQLSLKENEYWKQRGFENMEDYFLYKDFGIIPVYRLPKPYHVFWDLTERAAKVRRPRQKWLELIRPYLFNHEFMGDMNYIYNDITDKLKKVNPKLKKEEIDQIIYLGEKFVNRFIEKKEMIPTPLPDNEIILFEGLKLDSKNKYQQAYNLIQFLDYGLEPTVINKTTKEKLILGM